MSKRERTMQALIAATIRLLGERSEAHISVRDIGAAAGVNHGLVHHYFGSKAGLVRAAVQQASRALYEGQPAEVQLEWTFRFFRDHPELLRILARVVLDGPGELVGLVAPAPDKLAGWVDQLGGWLQARGLGTVVDPRVMNAAGAAAVMGWFLFKPVLEGALGLPEGADAELEKVVGWLDGLLARPAVGA